MTSTDRVCDEPERVRPENYRTWRPAVTDEAAFSAARYRVAILLLAQASLGNVFAILDDLAAVNHLPDAGEDRPAFAARILAAAPGPFTGLNGGQVLPHARLDTDLRVDAVVVPTLFDDGCLSDRRHGPLLSPAEHDWLCAQHAGGAIFSTMCSGVFALAETGLLAGREVAMHPLYGDAFAARYPQVRVHTRRSLVVSGEREEFITGGFSTYSADVSLYLIARLIGREAAYAFARLYQKDFLDPLPADRGPIARQTNARDLAIRLAQRFMLDHLHAPSLVGAAAAMAHLDERSFTRRFERETGLKPAEFVQLKRMQRARDLLSASRMPIEDVAARVGYRDRASFSRAFKAASGEPPAAYRRRTQAPVRLARAACGE